MKITEEKEVTHVTVDKVIVGRKCDICGKLIEPIHDGRNYNYFTIFTCHNDWGYESIESNEYFDACSPECVMKFTEDYIKKSFASVFNTKQISIEHVRSIYA